MVEGEKSRVLIQITGSDTDKIFEWFDANKNKFNIEVLCTMGVMPSDRNLAKPLGFCALLKANENNMIDKLVRIKSEVEKMNDWECNFLKTSEISIRNINSNLNPLIFNRIVSSRGQFKLFKNYYYIEANYRGKILDIVIDGKFFEVYYRGEHIKSYLFKNFSTGTKRSTSSSGKNLGRFLFNKKHYYLGKKYAKKEIIIKPFRNYFEVYIKGKFIKKIFPASGNS